MKHSVGNRLFHNIRVRETFKMIDKDTNGGGEKLNIFNVVLKR